MSNYKGVRPRGRFRRKLSPTRLRYVLVRNLAEARRDAAKREKHLEKLKKELAKLKELDGKAHTKAHCRLNTHLVYKKYLKMDAKGNLKINTQAVKEAERLDGKYLIRTSDDTLSVEDVAIGFKQLHEVEHAVSNVKNHVGTSSGVSSQGRTHSRTCRTVLVSSSSRPTGRSEHAANLGKLTFRAR